MRQMVRHRGNVGALLLMEQHRGARDAPDGAVRGRVLRELAGSEDVVTGVRGSWGTSVRLAGIVPSRPA